MKKYVLISSVLAVSITSNSMEQQIGQKPIFTVTITSSHEDTKRTEHGLLIPNNPSELTTEAQKRILLVPKVQFSLDDKVMKELQTINYDIKKLRHNFFATIPTDNLNTLSLQKLYALTEYQNTYKQLSDNLDNKLDLLLISEKKKQELTILHNNINNYITPQESALSNQWRDKQITKDEFDVQMSCLRQSFRKTSMWATLGDEMILLYQNAHEIKQFAEGELTKDEFDPLFIAMKEKYQKIVYQHITLINNFVVNSHNLSEEQEVSDK